MNAHSSPIVVVLGNEKAGAPAGPLRINVSAWSPEDDLPRYDLGGCAVEGVTLPDVELAVEAEAPLLADRVEMQVHLASPFATIYHSDPPPKQAVPLKISGRNISDEGLAISANQSDVCRCL